MGVGRFLAHVLRKLEKKGKKRRKLTSSWRFFPLVFFGIWYHSRKHKVIILDSVILDKVRSFSKLQMFLLQRCFQMRYLL